MRYLILYVASVVLGGAGAWLISRWGTTIGLLDRSNDRSSHDGVVPKGGGIGILAAFLLASWVLGLPLLFWLSIGLTALFSLYGDKKEIPAKVRLCVQFVAGVVLLVGLFYWESRGWPVYLLIPLFAIFVVGTANYYNFMDGINGIAGITAVVGFGLLAFYASTSGTEHSFVILPICIALSCLGFLPFNMPRARVFMGDVGSILVGFLFAAMVVMLSKSFLDFVCLAGFLFPFYADELTTLYVRIKDRDLPEVRGQRSVVGKRQGQRPEVGGRKSEDEGQKEGMSGLMGRLMKPHRRHVYQLLANEMRVEHWKVSVGYGVLQLVVGIGVLMVREYGTVVLVGFMGAWFAGFWIFGAWIRTRSADYADPPAIARHERAGYTD